jgi:MFS superfamily sulfate permease-like transporter
LKALTAVAVAEKLAPGVIHAAGFEIAVFLLLLSIKGVADRVSRLFTKPVVRALQLGVGVLLMITAAKMVADPPAVFRGTPTPPWPLLLAALAFALVAWASAKRRYEIAFLMLVAGVAGVVLAVHPQVGAPSLSLPHLSLPPPAAFGSAFFLLVVPQLPLTFGNAVVAVTELEHEYFGERARRVSASWVCVSCAAGNVVSALIGGMPICHGAGGLTAHVRLGARSAGMNVLLGTGLVGMGLFFAPQIPAMLGLLPVWVLAGFLAYAGFRHAWLVADLRGAPLIIAVVAGCVGAYLGNLAVTAAAALIAAHFRTLVRRT